MVTSKIKIFDSFRNKIPESARKSEDFQHAQKFFGISDIKDLNSLRENPANLDTEISILYELGLEPYEIEYIIFQKHKQETAEKWTK